MGEMLFRKGSSSSSITADTLTTNDTVEVLIGISEGPIVGPVNGPQSIFADNTALVDSENNPNLSNFSVDFWPGDEMGHDVTMALGGFGSPVNVASVLAHSSAVTRTGAQEHITAIDFRVVIQALGRQDDKGTYTAPLQLKFEYKATSSGTWLPCFTEQSTSNGSATPSDGTVTNWQYSGAVTPLQSFLGDRAVVPTDGEPADPATEPTFAVADDLATVYHWDTGSLVWTTALTTNATAAYVEFTDDDSIVRRIYKPATNPPGGARAGDVWQKTTLVYLIFNGTSWVTPVEYGSGGPTKQFLTGSVWSITDKISSNTPITIRCYVPDIAGTYDYRVTKLTQDSDTTNSSVVSWESVFEVNQNSWHFDALSMLKIVGQASGQFTSLATYTSHNKGRIIKVPTNYDPEARTYDGVWDGTYKLAYTNNTAWIFLDFVENTRYGLSSIFPHVTNKWKIYEWAQYCDEPVLKSDATYQPRWTFNLQIIEPTDAKEMAQFIAGSAAATLIDDGNGIIEVLIDQDDPAVALFTAENVSPEGFEYSYTEALTRANDLTVAFINPNLLWVQDFRSVTDPDSIDANGRVPDNFIAVGCIDVDEALRRGRRRLITGLTECESVSFTTNRKGRFLREWDVILVADPSMGRGLSGRIRSQTNSHTVQLRDPISLESGFTYKIMFDVATEGGFETFTGTVTTAAGVVTALTVSETLPALPPVAAFTLENTDGSVGHPKPYRILSIGSEGGDENNIQITGLELNRSKYSYIDGGASIPVIDYSSFSYDTVNPATLPKVDILARKIGAVTTRILNLSWIASTSEFVRSYKVYHSINGSTATVSEVTGTSAEFDGIASGLHTFTIVAVNIKGRESKPVNFYYNVSGSERPVSSPTDLRLVNGATDTTFDTIDAHFAFDPADEPNLAFYELQVFEPTDNTLLRTVNLGLNSTYNYDFGTNKIDGLHRSLTVTVCGVDQDDNRSDPITLTVNNPAPEPPAVTLVASPYSIRLRFDRPADTDYTGIVVWMSTTSGFTANDTTQVWKDVGNPTLPALPSTTYYLRYAFYDSFGLTGVGTSSEVSVVTPSITSGDLGGIDLPAMAATINLNTDEILQNGLRDVLFRRLQENLNYTGDGTQVKVVALNAIDQSTDAINRFDLLATIGGDGKAVLNSVDIVAYGTTTLAQHFDYVTTTLGDNTASVEALSTAVDGVAANYTLSANVNGHYAGVKIGATGDTSFFIIEASVFAFVDPSDPTNILYPLSFADGAWELNRAVTINGDLVVNGTITTVKLIVGAVTNATSVDFGSHTDISSQYTVATIVFDAGGDATDEVRVRVSWKMTIDNVTGVKVAAKVRVYRDGDLLGNPFYALIDEGDDGHVLPQTPNSYTVDFDPVDGDATYTVTVQTLNGLDVGTGGGTPQAANLTEGNVTIESNKR